MARFSPVPGLAVSLTLLAPSPALASLEPLALARAELSATEARQSLPDPALAGTLSWVVPLGLAVVTVPLGPFALVAGGIGTGAGHLYAGDPTRGILVGVGGVAAPLLGFGAGMGLGLGLAGLNQSFNSLGAIAVTGIVTGLASTVGYLVFASRDAYRTAERQQVPTQP